jgi:hypothetical protein
LPSADVPTTLADGQLVRVLLQTTQVDGAWVAIRLRSGVRMPDTRGPTPTSKASSHVFTSSTSFEVNGLTVDATNASFPDGTAGIVLGARVEVHGTVTDGVLVATKVEVQDRRDHGRRDLELRGELGNLDSTAKTFALRGVTVWYGGTVTYGNGTEADLANGKRVEVKGVLSADRTRLEARASRSSKVPGGRLQCGHPRLPPDGHPRHRMTPPAAERTKRRQPPGWAPSSKRCRRHWPGCWRLWHACRWRAACPMRRWKKCCAWPSCEAASAAHPGLPSTARSAASAPPPASTGAK